MSKILLAEAYIEIRGRMTKLSGDLDKTRKLVDKKLAGWETKLKPFEKGIRTLSVAMVGMGAAASAAITGLIVQTTRMGDALDKMAKRTGLSTEVLSQLGYAAEISGTDINTMEASLKYLSRAMDDVSQGIGESRVTFEKLGIQVTNTDGTLRSVVDILLESGDAINGLTSETEKVAAATDLFGRRGGALLPLLREGSAGMSDLMQRADELGLTISGKSAAAAAEFNDKLTDLRSSIAAASYKLGSLLLPTIQKITVQITGVISQISDWTKKHEFLVSTFLHLGAVVGPMLLAGGMFGLLLTQLGSITAAVKVLGATFSWFAAHPAVLAAAAIAILVTGLGLYIKQAHDAKDVTKLLAQSQEDLARLSAQEMETLLKRSREELNILGDKLEKLRETKERYEGLIASAKEGETVTWMLKDWEDRLIKTGEELRNTADEYSTILDGVINLNHAMESLGRSTDATTTEINDQVEALKALKDSLPKAEKEKISLEFLKPTAPLTDLQRLEQFVKGADIVKQTTEAMRKDLEQYQKRIILGVPDIPFERIQEMEKAFATMRERDLANQRAMAERGEQVQDQSLQDQQDNEEAFWALMEDWRQADIGKIVAYNQATEQAHLQSQEQQARDYEQAMEDRIKALELFYAQQTKEREQWLKDTEKANADLLDNWDDLVSQQGSFASQMQVAFERSATSMENSLARFFESFYYGMEEGKSAWEMFTEYLKQELVRAVAKMTATTLVSVIGSVLPFKEGGISPGKLQPTTTSRPGSFAFFQHGGIIRQPTMALIGEGSKPEAVVPLKGGKIPVEIRGGADTTIHMTNIIQFPNADPSNVDQANFERRFRNHITTTMRNMARDGTLNKVVMR